MLSNPYATVFLAETNLALQRSSSAPSTSKKSVLFNETTGTAGLDMTLSLSDLSKKVLQQQQRLNQTSEHVALPSYLRKTSYQNANGVATQGWPPSQPPLVSPVVLNVVSTSDQSLPSRNAVFSTASTSAPLQSVSTNIVGSASINSVAAITTANNSSTAAVVKKKRDLSQSKSKQRLQLKVYLMKLPMVRFVPKKATIRAITNLRTKFNGGSSNQYPISGVGVRRMLCNAIHNKAKPGLTSLYNNPNSNQSVIFNEVITNAQLYNCLHVLKHVFENNEEECSGFGVFGLDEIYRKLRSFQEHVGKKRTTTRHGQEAADKMRVEGNDEMQEEEPMFYIAAIDLEKCYDHVDTSLLYDLIKSTLAGKSNTGSLPSTQELHSSNSFSSNNSASLSRTTSAASSSSACNNNDKQSNIHENNTHAVNNNTNMHYLQQLNASMSASEFHQYLPTFGKLLEDAVIHKYSVTHAMSSMNRIVSKPLRYVCSSSDMLSFKEAGEEIASNYPNSLITDHVIYPKINSSEILRLLRLHLFQHIVKLPLLAKGDTDRATSSEPTSSSTPGAASSSRYCTQIRGIPQGSVLSPILCNFYYGYLENLLFHSMEDQAKLGLHTDSVIIRLMDDYLMISTKKSCVQYFLQTSCDSLKHYGGRINPLKTKLNFATKLRIDGQDVDVKPTLLHQPNSEQCTSTSPLKLMAWCGLLLNVDTLECYPDMSRILNRPLKHAVSMECHHIGSHFNRSIKSFFRMKCHAIFLDHAINSSHVIVGNLYDMFLVTALRTVTYLKRIRHAYRQRLRVDFVKKCIREGILFASRLIHIRTNRKISRKLQMNSEEEAYNDDSEEEEDDEDENSDVGHDDRDVDQSNAADHEQAHKKPTAPPLLYNRMKKAMEEEKSITHFGKCFISSIEAMAIGWYAFAKVFRASQLTYDQYHHLLKWLELNRDQCLTDLPHMDTLFPSELRDDCEARIVQKANVNP